MPTCAWPIRPPIRAGMRGEHRRTGFRLGQACQAMGLIAVKPQATPAVVGEHAARRLASRGSAALDALLSWASHILRVSQVSLHLSDGEGLWSLARPDQPSRRIAAAESPCEGVLRTLQSVAIADLREVAAPGRPSTAANWTTCVAYLGHPVVVDGVPIGTLCALDQQPRLWDPACVSHLSQAAATVAAVLALELDASRLGLAEERVRSASMAGSDWLWETDSQGRLQWVSAGLLQHTGLDPSSELGLSASDIMDVHGPAYRASWERYQKAREAKLPFHDLVAERLTPKGRLIVQVSGRPYFDEQGQLLGYRGATRNITRQHQAEQAAREADQLLRLAMEAMPMAVMVCDAQQQVVLTNRHWREAVGNAHDPQHPSWPKTLKRLIEQGMLPDAAGRTEAFMQWALELPQREQDEDLRFGQRWCRVYGKPLTKGCSVMFALDITRSRANAQLLESQRQALGESEARLMAVLRALPDLWFVIDDQNRYLLGHEGHPMLVSSMSQIIGQPLGAHLPADVAKLQNDAVAKARASGKAQTIVYDIKSADGMLRHFEARITPMPAGQSLYLTRDITDRKLAADKLRISEELYRSVAASISDGLVIVDLKGRVLALNTAARRILGLPSEQAPADLQAALGFVLLEDDLLTALPSENWPLAVTIRSGQRVVDRVHPARRVDHEIVWLQMSSNLIRIDADAPAFGAMMTFCDITKERLAIQDLALSEERWKFALEGAGDGVWDWDLHSGFVYYSTRWKQMLGYEEHEIADTADEFFSRVHPLDRDVVSHTNMAYVTEGAGIHQAEFRLRHRMGHYLSILSRGKVVSRAADGSPLRVVGTHSDITLLKEAEATQRDKQLYESASAAKSAFLSRMSHEIRTPLNAITGFAQLMRLQLTQSTHESPLRSYTEQILHAGRHLCGLVDDVLDLQRVEAGILSLNPQPIALQEEIVQCLSMLLPMAEQSEISMSSFIDAELCILADRQRLRQVLMNIGSNAIKYNQVGGSVVVRARDLDDGYVELSLTDTGEGMSDAQLQRLFQPFERLGRETSPIEGTGLGLIITRSLVESMGGRMSIESQLGLGTRVAVCLPASQAKQEGWLAPAQVEEIGPQSPPLSTLPPNTDATTALADPPVPTSDLPALRVLYVEDNRINALLFAEALRHESSIALEIAEDGEQALEMARQCLPEVLVLDAHLPGMSGFDVLRALRLLPGLEHAPAFMCSADAMPEDIQRAMDAGFRGYWTKPIDVVIVTNELTKLAHERQNVAT